VQIFLGCALLLAAVLPCTAEEKRYETELQPYIEKLMRTQDIPGLAIAVVRDGRVVYTHGFGIKTVNPSVVPAVFPAGAALAGPVTDRTLFGMASVTKTFVATAVMQLVSQGKITLDAPVVHYLPEFLMADERYRVITVRELLDHTSGMPDRNGVEGHGWDHPQFDGAALGRFVTSLKSEKLLFVPGERFQYSNVGYDVLGALIEKVSGEEFAAYLKAHILKPLKMTQSTLLVTEADGRLLATGHETSDAEDPEAVKIYPFNRGQSPSGGLVSNVHDMALYAVAQMRENGLLPRTAYPTMWAPLSTTPVPKGPLSHYGLGWYVGTFEGERAVSHTGKDIGFMSDLMMLPEKHVAVVWMMNAGWGGAVLSISEAAMDIALGKPMHASDVRRDLPAVLAGDLGNGKSIDWVLKKYFELRKTKAENFNFEELRMELFGDYLLRGKKTSDAVEVYRVNAEQFPDSARAKEKLTAAQKALAEAK